VFVISVDVKSSNYAATGEKATKLKELVKKSNIKGADYSQSFRQESNWDAKLNKRALGDWVASVLITVPFENDGWKTSGSNLLQKIVALNNDNSTTPKSVGDKEVPEQVPRASDRRSKALSGISPSSSGNGHSTAHVSITDTRFQVSNKLQATTELDAISLAVADAIARIGEIASLWLDDEKLLYFGADSLTQVRISNKADFGAWSPKSVHHAVSMDPRYDGSKGGGRDTLVELTFVDPGNFSITQRAWVSACVVPEGSGW
jgi:hypothetical protein